MPKMQQQTTAQRDDDLEEASDSDSAIVFAGHDAYIASVAKTCREQAVHTDVNIVVHDGEIKAHR